MRVIIINKKGTKNIKLPQVGEFENMGYWRSEQYQILTFDQILKKHKVSRKILEKNKNPFTVHVRNCAKNNMFLVPVNPPRQDANPCHLLSGETSALSIGATDLMEEFSQLVFGKVPISNESMLNDGDMDKIIEALKKPYVMPQYVERVYEWTNRYGLLFTEPLPYRLMDCHNIKSNSAVDLSDSLYRHIREEYVGVPYFMSIRAFCELSLAARWIIVSSWICHSYEQDKERWSLDNFIKGYEYFFAPLLHNYNQEVLREYGEEYTKEMQCIRLHPMAMQEVIKKISAGIRMEIQAKGSDDIWIDGLEYIDEETKERRVMPLDSSKKLQGGAVQMKYQCYDLYSCMMLEHLCTFQNKLKYRVCEVCGRVFGPEKRSDARYCSNGSKSIYQNCKSIADSKKHYAKKKDQ